MQMRKFYWRGDFFCHPANKIYTLAQIFDKILRNKKIEREYPHYYTLECPCISKYPLLCVDFTNNYPYFVSFFSKNYPYFVSLPQIITLTLCHSHK